MSKEAFSHHLLPIQKVELPQSFERPGLALVVVDVALDVAYQFLWLGILKLPDGASAKLESSHQGFAGLLLQVTVFLVLLQHLK